MCAQSILKAKARAPTSNAVLVYETLFTGRESCILSCACSQYLLQETGKRNIFLRCMPMSRNTRDYIGIFFSRPPSSHSSDSLLALLYLPIETSSRALYSQNSISLRRRELQITSIKRELRKIGEFIFRAFRSVITKS